MSQEMPARRSGDVGGPTHDLGEGGEELGHTPARIWVVTLVIIVGFVLVGVGIVIQSLWFGLVAAALTVGACIAAWAMGIMEQVE